MISNASSLTPPRCKQIPKSLITHNDERIDPYYWLNEKDNPEVLSYLEKENEYASEVMKSTETLQDQLFEEITGRIKKDDQSVPYKFNQYWYYTRYEEGKEYAIHCRKFENMDNDEQILLDVNQLAEGHAYCSVGGLSVSEDNKWMAFGIDTVSRRMYTIKVINLESREYLPIEIENTSALAVWANDNQTVFYTEKDEQTLRTNKIYRLNLHSGEKEMVFEEKDDTFYTYVTRTKSRKFILIGSNSSITSEYQWLPTSQPKGKFQVFQKRERGLEYSIAHHDKHWYVLTNWEAENFRLMKTKLESTKKQSWVEVIPHRSEVLLEDIELFDSHMVLEERINGQIEVRIIGNEGSEDYYLEFEETGYLAWVGHNPDYTSTSVQIGYTSMITPSSIYSYNFEYESGSLQTLKKIVDLEGGATILPEWATLDLCSDNVDQLRPFGEDLNVREVSLIYTRHFAKNKLVNALTDITEMALPEVIKKNKPTGIVEFTH
jgi:oligopeptidase B